MFVNYYRVKKKIFRLKIKNIYRDNIKTGDIFLLDWQRANNVFIASLFNNSFMHPSIAIWENNELFIIELINYFNDDTYKGLVKIPFNKWYRINKKALILHNVLSIKDEKTVNRDLRDKLAQKINKFYSEYKGKMHSPSGLNKNWLRFLNPKKEYKKIENYKEIICTEAISFLLKEIGVVKKNKSIESYQPDSFIGMKDFDFIDPYLYKEFHLASIKEL